MSNLYKKIGAVFIFFTVFCTLGVPFTQWGCFYNDEFSYLAMGKKTKTVKDLAHFFVAGDVRQAMVERNDTLVNYFDVLYRPLCCIFTALEYWAFENNTYYYHCLNVAIHACNAVLIFLLLTSMLSVGSSIFAALYFAFHPIIAYDSMRIDYFHIFVSLFFILLLIVMFKFFLKTKQYRYYFCALIIYTLAIFNRETVLSLIPIIGFWIGLYFFKQRKEKFLKICKRVIILMLPFCIIAVLYIVLKFFLYPYHLTSTEHVWSEIILKNIKEHCGVRLLSLSYDALGLSWLPYESPILRAMILVIIFFLLVILFFKSSMKMIIMCIGTSIFIMLWPCFTFCNYTQRYLYEPLPLVLLFFIILWNSSTNRISIIIKKITTACFVIIVFCYGLLCSQQFQQREKKIAYASKAIKELVSWQELTNRTLCFFGLPYNLVVGNHVFTRIIRLYRDDVGPIFEEHAYLDHVDDSMDNYNPIFITWNYQKNCFCTIKKPL